MVLPVVRCRRGQYRQLLSGISLDVASHLGVVSEDLLNLAKPAHVKSLGHVEPIFGSRQPQETSMLCAETKVFDHAPVLLQEVAIATGNQEDDIVGVLRQLGNGVARPLGRHRLRRNLNNRSERAL